jgi:hypothetical protein
MNSVSIGVKPPTVTNKQNASGSKITTANHSRSQSGSNVLPANGQVTTAAPKHENKNKSFSRGELFGAASISGITVGILIGTNLLNEFLK